MNPKSFISSFLLFLSLLFYSASAFNITLILGQYPDFSTFNDYLTHTSLAHEINSRQTITVLVVENSAMAPLSGKPTDVIKTVMSLHVILDYYDVPKVQTLINKTAIVTTLYQTSGRAAGQQGFLNVTDVDTGGVVFGSAVPGSPMGSNLVKAVVAQPYNISVLQISTVISPPGIANSNSSTATSPSSSPVHSPAPAPSGQAHSPSDAHSPPPSVHSPAPTPHAPAPMVNSPAPATPAPAAVPSLPATPPSNPNATSGAPSDAGTLPGSSPVSGPAADNKPVADAAPPPAKSSANTPAAFGIHVAVLMMALFSSWFVQ